MQSIAHKGRADSLTLAQGSKNRSLGDTAMSEDKLKNNTIGWIGAGRMGYEMVTRLLQAGWDVTVYNRTRAKAEPLADKGAKIVETPAELVDRDIVFTMVAGPADLEDVIAGPQGVLSNTSATPEIFVDCTSVDDVASEVARRATTARGAAFRPPRRPDPAGHGLRPWCAAC